MVDGRPYDKRSVCETEAQSTELAWRLRLSVTGEAAHPMDISQRVDAARALEILPKGVTLLDAVRLIAARGDAGKADLRDALAEWLKHRKIEVDAGRIIPRALWQDGWAVRTLCKAHAGATVGAVDELVAQTWIDGLPIGPYAKRGMRSCLRCAWNWMIGRRMAASNPWQRVKTAIPETSVAILTPEETEQLLAAARAGDPATLRFALLGLAAGLRPAEAARISRADLLPPHTLHVRALHAKTRRERYVEVDPAIFQILNAEGEWPSDLPGSRWRKVWVKVRRAAGWGKARSWPQDVLRHSFASYHLALHKDRPHLAEILGNTVEVIARHYRRPVTIEEARRYWAVVTPGEASGNP